MGLLRGAGRFFYGPGLSAGKIVAYMVAFLIFGLSVYVLIQRHEMNLIVRFQSLRRVDPLPRARELAQAGEYCQALKYLDYFMDYDYVRNDPAAVEFYREISKKRRAVRFRVHDLWSGVWKGKGACLESWAAATVTDFLVVGDIRDLSWGVYNKWAGKETSDLTMALAATGLLLEIGTLVGAAPSGGSAVPAGISAKVGISLLKLANKLGKIPKSIEKGLVRLLKRAVRTKSVRPLIPFSRSLYRISKVDGMKVGDVMAIISRSRNIRDIKFMERVARTFGKKTGKFLELGGRAPLTLVRRYGRSKHLTRAMDEAVKYGKEGSDLLVKTGPRKFLRYLSYTKYGVRAVRSSWEGRLTTFLASLVSLLPSWLIYLITLASGSAVVGAPAVYAWRRVRKSRETAAA